MNTSDNKTNSIPARPAGGSNGVNMNTIKVGVFILVGLISIITYGWQCGSIGQNQYDYYPYTWISGSSNTGVITTSYTGTLTGTVNPGGVQTSVYFEWGSVYGWIATTPRSVGNGNLDVTVSQTLTSLLPNTTYTYRLAILRGDDLTYSENQSFTTAGRPSCTTEIATNVSSLSATLNGIVNPNGLTTTAYFQWGLSYSFGNTTAEQSIGSGRVNIYVAANIIGLSANTAYFYRVVAVNSEGTVYGATWSFSSGPPFPVAATLPASSISYNSATLNGRVNPNNQDTTINFLWGPTASYGNTTSAQIIPAGTSNVNVSANLTGLAANTTYYYRLTARNPAGDSSGAQQSFTTLSPPPIAVTTSVATTTFNSAILTATVNPNGLPTTAYFQWGTSIPYGSSTLPQSLGSGITDVSITATLAGLVGNTTYNYRVVATNSSGTTNGSNQSFSTLVPPPTATTNPASGVTTSTATLNSSVNPNGGATTIYFEWGTTTAYGNSTPVRSIGSGTGFVISNALLTGLTTSTLYNFRIVAVNGTGTTNGSNRIFTTGATPPTAITLPASDVTTSTFTLNATVNPNGVTTSIYFQLGTTASYDSGWSNSSNQFIGNGRTPVAVTALYPSGVTPGVTYYYRIQAQNAGGTVYGEILSFSTPALGAPIVSTTAATNVGTTSAWLNGTVNPNGGTTTVYFQWGLTTSYGNTTSSQNIGNGTASVDVVSQITGLTSGTTYYYRVVATNANGTSTGGPQSFITLAGGGGGGSGAPSVTTNAATNITSTNARLNGIVNSNGLSTTVYFRYRTASPVGSWNIQSPPLDNGSDTSDWFVFTNAQLLPVLAPNTNYNFQVYATNTAGTTYGAILSFTTLP